MGIRLALTFGLLLYGVAGTSGAGLADDAAPALPEPIRSAGTAWATSTGHVVTNLHLVRDRESVFLVDFEGVVFEAEVAARDESNDIAVLTVAEPSRLPPGLPISAGDLRLGSGVFTLGFPRIDVMGMNPKLSHGVVSGLTGVMDDPNSFLVSVPIQPGNSGGPILDMRGEVVGMVTSMVAAEDEASGALRALPNVNCAVRADIVESLDETVPARDGVAVTESGRGDLESVVARVRDSVLIVMVP